MKNSKPIKLALYFSQSDYECAYPNENETLKQFLKRIKDEGFDENIFWSRKNEGFDEYDSQGFVRLNKEARKRQMDHDAKYEAELAAWEKWYEESGNKAKDKAEKIAKLKQQLEELENE